MTSRDEFEAWYHRRWPHLSLERAPYDGGPLGGLYINDSVQDAWAGWEASRTERTCEWTGDGEFWASSCGRSWTLIDGTPKDNSMDYCHGCGARVVTE